MVKLKEQTILSREDLSKYLLDLAAQLSKGQLSFQDIELEIPSNLSVKYKYKQKDGYSKFKLSLSWGDVPLNTSNEKYFNARSVPDSYKKLKKQFEATLNILSNTISSGKLPLASQTNKLTRLAQDSTKQAKPKLIKGMQAMEKVVLDLKKAIEIKDIGLANEKVKLLYQLKENYHRQYK